MVQGVATLEEKNQLLLARCEGEGGGGGGRAALGDRQTDRAWDWGLGLVPPVNRRLHESRFGSVASILCPPSPPWFCPHTQRAVPESPLHFPNPPVPHRDTKPPSCCTETPENPHALLRGTSLSPNSLSSHRFSSSSSPSHMGTALVTHTHVGGSKQSILLWDRPQGTPRVSGQCQGRDLLLWGPCDTVSSVPSPGAAVLPVLDHLECSRDSSRGMVGINPIDPQLMESRAEHVQVPPAGCPQRLSWLGWLHCRASNITACLAGDVWPLCL